MPTSVLLAVLAAAGLLALAPALVRRYDATERLVAERALSTARVLPRRPPSPHRARTPTAQPAAGQATVTAPPVPGDGTARPAAGHRPGARRGAPAAAAGTPRPSSAAAASSRRCCCST